MTRVESLIKGVREFQRGYFEERRETFADLAARGQNPHTLFITCADSRIMPQVITNTDPGDLFVMRNVGNMVPVCDGADDCMASAATIEYAVTVLQVSEIVVCGHSHCGACASLFDAANDHGHGALPITRKWLRQGERVRDLILELTGTVGERPLPVFASPDARERMLRMTEKAMVLQHMSNLMTYPAVARRVAEGRLRLHGWHYLIEEGVIEAYDAGRRAFVALGGRCAAPAVQLAPRTRAVACTPLPAGSMPDVPASNGRL